MAYLLYMVLDSDVEWDVNKIQRNNRFEFHNCVYSYFTAMVGQNLTNVCICTFLSLPHVYKASFPSSASFPISKWCFFTYSPKCHKREIPWPRNPRNFMWIYYVWNTYWRSAYFFFFLSFGILDVLFSSFNLNEYSSNFITESARLFWAFLLENVDYRVLLFAQRQTI